MPGFDHPLCATCNAACCRGLEFAPWSDDERDALPDELASARNARSDTCPHLSNGRCTIWDRRPLVCRNFQPGGELCEHARRDYGEHV